MSCRSLSSRLTLQERSRLQCCLRDNLLTAGRLSLALFPPLVRRLRRVALRFRLAMSKRLSVTSGACGLIVGVTAFALTAPANRFCFERSQEVRWLLSICASLSWVLLVRYAAAGVAGIAGCFIVKLAGCHQVGLCLGICWISFCSSSRLMKKSAPMIHPFPCQRLWMQSVLPGDVPTSSL